MRRRGREGRGAVTYTGSDGLSGWQLGDDRSSGVDRFLVTGATLLAGDPAHFGG